MLELYYWTTPNGRKPLILLEELGLPYEKRPVHIGNGEQHDERYLRINPNAKIPALVDHRGDAPVTIFESGAILLYLAEHEGRFLPTERGARARTLSWLMFQMGGVGPMLGQAGHFLRREERNEYAIERYVGEAKRLYGVLDKRLGEAPYLAGDDYTVADIATYPWVQDPSYFGFDLEPYPHVRRWLDELGARPAVKRAMAVEAG